MVIFLLVGMGERDVLGLSVFDFILRLLMDGFVSCISLISFEVFLVGVFF